MNFNMDRLLDFSLELMGGTKKSFDNAIQDIFMDLNLSFIVYYRNIHWDGDKGRMELYLLYPREDINTLAYEKIQYGKMCFDNAKEVAARQNYKATSRITDCFDILGDNFSNKHGLNIPVFIQDKLYGVLFLEFIPGMLPQDIENHGAFFENLAKLMAKACNYSNMLFQVSRSESKYKAILENIEDGYFEVDLAGNLRVFNHAVTKISGLSGKELMGINNRAYTTPSTAKNMFRVFNEVYKTSIPLKLKDYEIILKHGERKWVELSASLIKDEFGNKVGFRGLVRDITVRKKAETERKKLEEKLNHAQRLEAIGTLAGGIAHDFNNILMAIQGNVSLIASSSHGDQNIMKKVNAIEKSIDSGANLTRQLIGFARGGKYIPRACNINKTIQASLVMFSRAHKDIVIETEFTQDLWYIEADQSQIEQILMNLYLNAWHAIESDGRIVICTKNCVIEDAFAAPYGVKGGKYVELSVSDNGCGMSEDVKKRIFEPFFTTRSKGRGTGLGLASVFGIVKNHGGIIRVESLEFKGTTFHIYFPAIGESEKAWPDLYKAEEIKKRTVLLVDDEETILEVGSAMLSEIGYNVVTANGGKKAVSIFKEGKVLFDFVIIDIVMPDMDGYETYMAIEKISPGVKVLFSSGYMDEENMEFDLTDKSNILFISKPYNLSSLLEKIAELGI